MTSTARTCLTARSFGHDAHEYGDLMATEDAGYWLIGLNDGSPAAVLIDEGVAHQKAGRFKESLDSFQQADGLIPDRWEPRNNIAGALIALGQGDRALEILLECRQADPTNPALASNLMHLQYDRKDWVGCQATMASIRDLGDPQSWIEVNVGTAQMTMLEPAEAKASFERALRVSPDDELVHHKLIYVSDFDPDVTAEDALNLRTRWYETHGKPLPHRVTHDNVKDPDRPLKVGYVGGDFYCHSALYCFGPVIRRHSDAIIPYVYSSTSHVEDPYTAALKSVVPYWQNVVGVSDADLADQITRDAIDVLVDLSGFTTNTRLLVFARKPAPVQVTAWGYATGTGMARMDAFFADSVVVPDHLRKHYTEEVIHLPSVVPFESPWVVPFDFAPEVGRSPAREHGIIRFGSLNRAEKINARVIAAWIDILRAVPDSRLILKSHQLHIPEVQAKVKGWFTDGGIDAVRLDLVGTTPHPVHMQVLNCIDITLDTFPHTGGVSALESLYMGVPVVTMLGDRSVNRLSASFLTQMGHTDWIAESHEEYVQIAVNLAKDVDRLAAIRRTMRDRMKRAPFCQLDTYTDAVETAYRRLWHRWCERAA